MQSQSPVFRYTVYDKEGRVSELLEVEKGSVLREGENLIRRVANGDDLTTSFRIDPVE